MIGLIIYREKGQLVFNLRTADNDIQSIAYYFNNHYPRCGTETNKQTQIS